MIHKQLLICSTKQQLKRIEDNFYRPSTSMPRAVILIYNSEYLQKPRKSYNFIYGLMEWKLDIKKLANEEEETCNSNP